MKAKRKIYIKNCTGNDCKNKFENKLFSRIIFNVLFVFFICSVFYVLFFSTYLKINNIHIENNREIKKEDILAEIDSYLNDKYFNFLSKNNFIIFSDSKIENLLKEKFKKIRSVTFEKKFPNTVNIKIEERTALMVWCLSEKCFLIDEKGVAYVEADFSSDNILQNNLIKIIDKSNYNTSIGDIIINESLENFILSLEDAFKKEEFGEIIEYSMPSRVADEINIKTSKDVVFYFSTQFSVEKALKTLDVVVKNEIQKNDNQDIEYIDLRSENKVFYKLKNQVNNDSKSEEEKNNENNEK